MNVIDAYLQDIKQLQLTAETANCLITSALCGVTVRVKSSVIGRLKQAFKILVG